jgi:hypothetical protein
VSETRPSQDATLLDIDGWDDINVPQKTPPPPPKRKPLNSGPLILLSDNEDIDRPHSLDNVDREERKRPP